MTGETVPFSDWVTALKAAAEPTRLRLLLLLAEGELNVKDLTLILGQSQPRLSRHLKLLSEAGLIERYREGSWAYFQVSDRTALQRHVMELLASVDPLDPTVVRDRARAVDLKQEREASAQAFFRSHAADWDRIRALHVSEAEVEACMRDALGHGPFPLFVDLGTGTGRMLELFQDRFERGIGIDVNQAMLSYARSRLNGGANGGASPGGSPGASPGPPGRMQLRHGDLYNLSLPDRSVSVVCMHQVLHYLLDPRRAILEAARVLEPGGRLLIADFAPHGLDYLRDEQAHERLGFADDVMIPWLKDAGLAPRPTRFLRPVGEGGGDKLTVSVWVAESPPVAGPAVLTSPYTSRTPIKETN